MTDTSLTPPWTLRDLPFAARMTLAVFLISVGIGYLSALVQLHFQHATPGSMLPTPEDAVRKFSLDTGAKPLSRIELLLTRDESLPFNGSGQMRSAFTRRSEGWEGKKKAKAKAMAKNRRQGKPTEEELKEAEAVLREEREGERLAILAWIQAGASKTDFEQDKFYLPAELAKHPIAADWVNPNDPAGPSVKIKSLWEERCASCHQKDAPRDAKAGEFPMENLGQISKYLKVETSSAMSLDRLAQTTHVHLLGFSMLYMLTGVLFALTSYPGVMRVPLAPLPLLAQIVDISFWWLARMDAPYGPEFARAIPISGAIVAAGLLIHIVGTLFDLFGKLGKSVLFVLLVAAVGGGYGLKEKVIDKHLAAESQAVSAAKQ